MRYHGKNFDEYVIVYDISSDNERAKVDKVLRNYGFRVQKSVFECKLNDSLKRKLISELRGLNIRTGFIKIYKLTDTIDAETLGNAPENIDSRDAFIV